MAVFLIYTRRLFQIGFLGLFVYLFAKTFFPLDPVIGVDFFMSFNPLAVITSAISGRAFDVFGWLFLASVALGVLAGRFFCGWMCPLGTIFDILERGLGLKYARRFIPLKVPSKTSKIKYFILLVSILVAVFGIQISGWFDPISIVTRTFGSVFFPLFDNAFRFYFGHPENYAWAVEMFPLNRVSTSGAWLITTFALFILAGTLIQERFWCRNLCPLGALYAILGRFKIFSVVILDNCRGCGKCGPKCKTGAIKNNHITQGECVLCMNCLGACKFAEIKPLFSMPFNKIPKIAPMKTVQAERRVLISSAAFALLSVPLVWLLPGEGRKAENSKLIRPPGALPENEFLARCVSCGLCVKVCINNALHLTVLEAGFSGVMTPRLIPSIGYCETSCTLCGQVCPTGAIKKLSLEEKCELKYGRAYLNDSACLPLSENTNCGVCEEHCPPVSGYEKAIYFEETGEISVSGDPLKKPVVNHDLCTGCGICENKCPLRPIRGIEVFAIPEEK